MPAKKSGEQTGERSNLQNFEKDFLRLNEIVVQLEAGNISLDEMLKVYEEGMKLAERLRVVLDEAELSVQTLTKAHEEMNAERSGPAPEALEEFLLEE